MKNLSEYIAIIISSDTVRLQDTIPAMLQALCTLAEAQEYASAIYQQICAMPNSYIPAHAMEDQHAEWWKTRDAEYRYEGLFSALDECAPAGYYFGTNPNDPAELGFFPVFEPVTPMIGGYFLARMNGDAPRMSHYSECIHVVCFADMMHEDASDMRLPELTFEQYESILIAIMTERRSAFKEGMERGEKSGFERGYANGKTVGFDSGVEYVEREFEVGQFSEGNHCEGCNDLIPNGEETCGDENCVVED